MSGFAELARAAETARQTRPGVALALATLVEVEGSSYRQPGARLLVDAEGRVLAGAISGGCLEGDVAARAADVCTASQAIVLRYDLRDDLETIWGFGSACDGIAHIVLEPIGDGAWLRDAADVRASRAGGVLLTIAARADGATNDATSNDGTDTDGVGTDGVGTLATGTVALLTGRAHSGGSWRSLGAHRQAISESHGAWDITRALRLAEIAQKTASTEMEQVERGQLRYFVEPLLPVVSLYLVGAGRGAEAFARIGTTLGWEITVIDHRSALLDDLSLPAGVRTVCARAADAATLLTEDDRTAVALLSHVYDVDFAWLTALLPRAIGYLGVLGSRRRAARLLEALAPLVHSARAASRRVHAPIGLDLGGESPESIALAAIAEIEAVMHARPGGFLRERESPIHTRTRTPTPPPIHPAHPE